MIIFRIRKLVGERIAREQRHISLAEVAKESGVGRAALNQMANNRNYVTSTDKLNLLCRYFGCKPEDLIEYVEDPPDWIPPPPRQPRKRNPTKKK